MFRPYLKTSLSLFALRFSWKLEWKAKGKPWTFSLRTNVLSCENPMQKFRLYTNLSTNNWLTIQQGNDQCILGTVEDTKGQLISKKFFWCLQFFQKTNLKILIFALAYSQWFQWSNTVQQIRFINFCFYKFLLVQIGANIMPHNNLSHFDTFGHDYW